MLVPQRPTPFWKSPFSEPIWLLITARPIVPLGPDSLVTIPDTLTLPPVYVRMLFEIVVLVVP
ncbi:hypothetical protein GYB29_08320 [bacterium]|nr:hypothetical protein [bacterium]